MHRSTFTILAAVVGAGIAFIGSGSEGTAQPMTKAQVARLITRVELRR